MNDAERGLQERLSYSVAEVIELTGLKKSFLYEEMKAGRLKKTKRGSRTLILREELVRYLKDLDDVD